MGRISREEYEKARIKYNMPMTYEEMVEKNRGYDSPDSLNNFEATVIYLVVMVIGAIFNDRIGIWIIATVIYFMHMTRHMKS